ncbi:hypothetical protein XENORESO_021923 [Xenotaenia resolanae]|uniref:Uncharacterized protein n=1 Tax=Xenotaenia resolanae TaxID=208358 RepID=A0ABV0WSG7_9TELE
MLKFGLGKIQMIRKDKIVLFLVSVSHRYAKNEVLFLQSPESYQNHIQNHKHVKLSKIMSALKGGCKRCHKSGDGHSTNGLEHDGPAASTSTGSVIHKDVISAVGGLNKKWRSGIDPAWKEAFHWLEITADEAGRPSHWVICAHFRTSDFYFCASCAICDILAFYNLYCCKKM